LPRRALELAKKDPKAPRCGNTVKKAARFCSKCGSGAPGGWWQCPACGKWVGNESNFCWNCNQPMNPERRPGMSGGVWQRSAAVFAEKFDAGDIKRLLKENGLIVEAGTAAILMDGGRFKDVLQPGRYNLDGLARKINNWGDPPPRTVVLVENGDLVLPLRIDNLRSADGFPVEFYTEVAFHFVEGAPRTSWTTCSRGGSACRPRKSRTCWGGDRFLRCRTSATRPTWRISSRIPSAGPSWRMSSTPFSATP
jgi:hypothetical protein